MSSSRVVDDGAELLVRVHTLSSQDASASAAGTVAIARPGESRFHCASARHCRVTSQDSGGDEHLRAVCAVGSGPVRHVHHREDEWCYVAAGEFAFEVGAQKFTPPVGGSVLMRREVPHVWANADSGGRPGAPPGIGRIASLGQAWRR